MRTSGAAATVAMAAFLLSACGGGEDGEQQASPAVEAEVDSAHDMAGMEGMEGMDGMSADGGMMGPMMAHMEMMRGMTPDSMRAMMPQHRQMAANMIAEMNRQMRDMNMAGDASWNATIDSLRQDLVRMPEMSAAELQVMMPGHHARMMRLMERNQEMMKGMER